jgi:hypothetical protein
MQKLLINDFSLQVLTELEQSVPEGKVDLTDIAEKLVAAFPYVLRPEDVSINRNRRPYDYRLLCKLFNGSADVSFASKTVISNFRDGRTGQALNLVAKSVEAIYKIVVLRPVQFNQLTFLCHAQFESADKYKDHMAKYVDVNRGYLSGGRIVQAEGRVFKGEMRLSTEKSLGFENSLFINAQFVTQEALTNEAFEQMAKRFNEIAGYEGFEFSFP